MITFLAIFLTLCYFGALYGAFVFIPVWSEKLDGGAFGFALITLLIVLVDMTANLSQVWSALL